MNFPKLAAAALSTLVATGLARASALSELAASMQPGTWAELVTKGLTDSMLLVSPGHIFQWSDRAVWNPKTSEVMFIGGAHAPGDNKRFITYDEATNTWKIESTPNWFCMNGAGCIMHAYEHNAINQATGELFHRPFNGPKVFKFNTGTRAWSELPAVNGDLVCCMGMVYQPNLDGVVLAGGGWVYFWKTESASWTKLNAAKLSMGSYNNLAIYNPVEQETYFGGGNGNKLLYRLKGDRTISPIQESPAAVGIGTTIWSVDPVSGQVLVIARPEASGPWTQGYLFDPASNSWQAWSIADNPIAKGSTGNTVAVATPIEDHKVIMYIRYSYDKPRVYLYKHAAQAVKIKSPKFEKLPRSGFQRALERGGQGHRLDAYDIQGNRIGHWEDFDGKNLIRLWDSGLLFGSSGYAGVITFKLSGAGEVFAHTAISTR